MKHYKTLIGLNPSLLIEGLQTEALRSEYFRNLFARCSFYTIAGGNRMSHRVWRPNIGCIRHTIVACWNPFTFEGELVVDGPVTKTWGSRMAGPDINLEIEGHPAFRRNNLVVFDLYIDGEKVQHSS